MIPSLIILASCAAALSGTAQAQDVSTNFQACLNVCVKTLGTDAADAIIKCNPVTVLDSAKCACVNNEIFSPVQSCVARVCPVFNEQLKNGCDDAHDVKASGAGEASLGGISRLVASGAVIVGTLLL